MEEAREFIVGNIDIAQRGREASAAGMWPGREQEVIVRLARASKRASSAGREPAWRGRKARLMATTRLVAASQVTPAKAQWCGETADGSQPASGEATVGLGMREVLSLISA